jgi:CD109 antigen
MLQFAPNVFVARYLKESGQTKPEVMARAERMMLTGYQRELIYRRNDGSFSAFGQSDQQGSLWLTAFVLKTFAQARGLIFVDDAVLASARDWIKRQQRSDGSFEPVGFVHHQELLGGLNGRAALTAFVAVALLEAGESAAGPALRFLEGELTRAADAYTLALGAYALSLGKSTRAREVVDRLLRMARKDGDALSWDGSTAGSPLPPGEGQGEGAARGQGDGPNRRLPGVAEPAPIRPGLPAPAPIRPPVPLPRPSAPALIETTAYAALALLQVGDTVNATRSIRWLAGKRNAQGGFGSTQDTVVALQAIAASAAASRTDVDATLTLTAGGWRKELRVGADNADVVQVLDVPTGGPLQVDSRGRGQLLLQTVRRFNLPAVEAAARSAFEIDVRYGADRVEVNDQIEVRATLRYAPPEPLAAGMVVVDVAVPTGFAHVAESLDALMKREPRVKRWDAAGRKVVLYVEDMRPGDTIALAFQARALYPVKAQATASQAYAYYRPEWRGEVLASPPKVGAGAG